jgi:hypothetical protein
LLLLRGASHCHVHPRICPSASLTETQLNHPWTITSACLCIALALCLIYSLSGYID